MKTIPPHRVNKHNSNVRKYSDQLWRELRKLRFKPADPDLYTNEMAAEEVRLRYEGDRDFDHDVNRFCSLMLSSRESDVFKMYVYGGKITQMEIAGSLGVTQGLIAQDLARILPLFKEFYYGDV